VTGAVRKVACPGCGEPAEYSPANPHRPFCGERCRLNDLGAWASESDRARVPLLPGGARVAAQHGPARAVAGHSGGRGRATGPRRAADKGDDKTAHDFIFWVCVAIFVVVFA
jgi:endogenous inhibitor of DNA gyrase (YacG/DUF329 family)